MAKFYYVTIKYAGGHEVPIVHKGEKVSSATARLLRRIGAEIVFGDALPPEKAKDYEAMAAGVRAPKRFTWHPRIEDPEGGDDGGD